MTHLPARIGRRCISCSLVNPLIQSEVSIIRFSVYSSYSTRIAAWIVGLGAVVLGGCIQHRYLSNIWFDGAVSHTYEAIGDSADLYDGKITLPTGLWWNVETGVVRDSSGNDIYTYRASMRLRTARSLPSFYAPESTHCPEIFLRHPVDFRRIDGWFGVLFLYKQTFQSRQKEVKYGSIWDYVDPECEILLQQDKADSLSEEERSRLEDLYLAGLVDWTRAMLLKRCTAVLERDLAMHRDVSFSQDRIEGALSAARAELAQWEPEMGGTELLLGGEDLWDSIGRRALQSLSDRLEFVGNTTFFADLHMLGDMLQWEYQITKDLEDDEFEVRLTMPGYVFRKNAEDVSRDTLVWEFSGTDIFNEDMIITAESVHVRWLPVILLGLAIVAVLTLFVRRRKPPEVPPVDLPT